MGLNYDLGDKSENLRRMNNFENLIRLIEFFWQKMLDLYNEYLGVKECR